MNSVRPEPNDQPEDTHRHNLWRNLQQRVKAAAGDPTLLAMLAREAWELGFEILPSDGATSSLPDLQPKPD